jgi:glycosyltransferase involved in cell wall biosynthesis
VTGPGPVDVVFGIPIYRPGRHLREAFESLLAQTLEGIAFVVADDGSDDEAVAIIRSYSRSDPRLSYHRNERRLGLVGNWRRAFELARSLHPGARYFAWGSDHDAWHPRWAERLVAELETCSQAVLAYPRNCLIAEDGSMLRAPWSFDTEGIGDTRKRMKAACRGMLPGEMVYGLYRADALARGGVLRPVLLPDRLLLTELSLQGELRQVPEILWYRRRTGRPSLRRQRATLFQGGPPPYALLPWWLVHAGALGWILGVRGAEGMNRSTGLRLAAVHAWVIAAYAGRRRIVRIREAVVQGIVRAVVGFLALLRRLLAPIRA